MTARVPCCPGHAVREGAVDEAALRALARWRSRRARNALVPCGTTGEGATLPARSTT